MVKIHELKTWPSAFEAIVGGQKQHEWRRNDRDFQVADKLILEEYDPEPFVDSSGYTGRKVLATITYMTENFGVPAGWCCMSFRVDRLILEEETP